MQRRISEFRERTEYELGRHRVPVDVVLARSSPREITRPIPSGPARAKGPTMRDLARLDTGELTMLRVDRYRLERRLGKGGMASVYQGVHVAMGRPVAVKVLTRDLSEHPSALADFLTEARLCAMISHPNVIEVSDFGATPEGIAYLVMPLHEGEDLHATLRREGPLSWPRARSLILQLCAALEAVHAMGIVHRDVKPANCLCMLEADRERLVLADFGVACRLGGAPEHAAIGTPKYMSPEQARGETVDVRADVYSLGIVLGEMLTGHVPFSGQSSSAVLDGHVHDPPPTLLELAEPGTFLPTELEPIYKRALAKRASQRFATVGEFVTALLALGTVTPHSREVTHHSAHSDGPHTGLTPTEPFSRPASWPSPSTQP
ncbi:serine/threonine-protein kinase [Nannocystaceae bacterium ST9]